MSLEDSAPKRSQIAVWLREAEEEVKKTPGRPSLPKQAKSALRANQRSAVHSKLEEFFGDLPQTEKDKILSDLDSYKAYPTEPRASRQF